MAWHLFRTWDGRFLYTGGTGGLNPAGAQCTNLPNTYLEASGVKAIYGDAWTWVGAQPRGTRWHNFEGDHQLESGDILVFGRSTDSPEGHVCVVLDASREPVVTMDQNLPLGTPVGLRRHGTTNCVGFIRV